MLEVMKEIFLIVSDFCIVFLDVIRVVIMIMIMILIMIIVFIYRVFMRC